MHVHRIAPAAVAAAIAVAGLASAAPAQAAGHMPWHRTVTIAAVQYDSPGRDNGSNRSLNREWVEIANNTDRPVDLDGWTLSDAAGHRYRFGHLRLGVHDSVRVHTGRGFDTRRDVYQGRRAYVWNNYRDTATLRNDRGLVVDIDSWGPGRPGRGGDHLGQGDHRGGHGGGHGSHDGGHGGGQGSHVGGHDGAPGGNGTPGGQSGHGGNGTPGGLHH